MSDTIAARLGGDTPEQIAYKLLILVGDSEKKLSDTGYVREGADRKWILDTYSECLDAVKGNREYPR